MTILAANSCQITDRKVDTRLQLCPGGDRASPRRVGAELPRLNTLKSVRSRPLTNETLEEAGA